MQVYVPVGAMESSTKITVTARDFDGTDNHPFAINAIAGRLASQVTVFLLPFVVLFLLSVVARCNDLMI